MSLNASLSNALSGLGLASKSAELISSNIANASNPTYGRRTIAMSSRANASGGVHIDAVQRAEAHAIRHELRTSHAALGGAQVWSDYMATAHRIMGSVQNENSLGNELSSFKSALISSAAAPNDNFLLQRLAQSAADLGTGISNRAKGLADLKTTSQTDIRNTVRTLNKTLAQVQKLNTQIATSGSNSQSKLGYLDQRDAALNKLAEIVPFKIYNRDNGKIALYTPEGQALVDGKAQNFKVETDGDPVQISIVSTADTSRALAPQSGALAKQLDFHNHTVDQIQRDLNSFAENLTTEFASLDPTATAGQSGLFQMDLDKGAIDFKLAPDILNSSWKIRDGANALAQSDPPRNDILNAMIDALATTSSLFETTNALGQTIEIAAADADIDVSNKRATVIELDQINQQGAVNSDQEMQHLLVVEQAYQANAKVIEIVDGLYDQLLRIG